MNNFLFEIIVFILLRDFNEYKLFLGRPVTLTETEEQAIAEYCATIDRLNLRLITKNYLDRTNRNVPKFKNNLPGDDWARAFMLTVRSIKRKICHEY